MKIALLAGDGIGPEILREARARARRPARATASTIETEEALVGGAAYDAHGDPLPEATLEARQAVRRRPLRRGRRPAVRQARRATSAPSSAILDLRKECDFFANLRPATVFPELADASSLKPEVVSAASTS